MSHTDHLVRLALAAVRGPHDCEGIAIPDHLEITPEGGRDAAVVGIFDYGGEPAVLDELSPLAAELEFVARVVDRPGAIRLHIDATLDGCQHLIQAGIPRFQVEIGHTVDRRPIPATGA